MNGNSWSHQNYYSVSTCYLFLFLYFLCYLFIQATTGSYIRRVAYMVCLLFSLLFVSFHSRALHANNNTTLAYLQIEWSNTMFDVLNMFWNYLKCVRISLNKTFVWNRRLCRTGKKNWCCHQNTHNDTSNCCCFYCHFICAIG